MLWQRSELIRDVDATRLALPLAPQLDSASVSIPRRAWFVWVSQVNCSWEHQSKPVVWGLWTRKEPFQQGNQPRLRFSSFGSV